MCHMLSPSSIEHDENKNKCCWKNPLSHVGGGGQGGGRPGERGWEVYGRREKRGREVGFSRWREAGEKGKNYATLYNILQSKKCKEGGANKYMAGTGIKGYGKREVYTLLSPPPPLPWNALSVVHVVGSPWSPNGKVLNLFNPNEVIKASVSLGSIVVRYLRVSFC